MQTTRCSNSKEHNYECLNQTTVNIKRNSKDDLDYYCQEDAGFSFLMVRKKLKKAVRKRCFDYLALGH